MLTSFDKALAALFGVIIYVLVEYVGISSFLGVDFTDAEAVDNAIQQLTVILSPLLVWAIPNKA